LDISAIGLHSSNPGLGLSSDLFLACRDHQERWTVRGEKGRRARFHGVKICEISQVFPPQHARIDEDVFDSVFVQGPEQFVPSMLELLMTGGFFQGLFIPCRTKYFRENRFSWASEFFLQFRDETPQGDPPNQKFRHRRDLQAFSGFAYSQ